MNIDDGLIRISKKYGIPIEDLKKEFEAEEKDGGEAEESVWLIPYLKKRISENRNANLIFVGDTGSGKSYSAISLGEQIDENFSVDRIVFTARDFLHLVNSDLPKGSVIIFDDAGLGIPAREWQSVSAKVFGLLFQGFRYKNLISMITVPDMSFIERQSRMLMHIYFEATDKHGYMKPFIPFHPIRGDDMLGFRYPVITRGGKEIQITLQKFYLPSADIIKAYEEKKQTYMEERNRQFEKELIAAELLTEKTNEYRMAKIEELTQKIERRRYLVEKAADLKKRGYTVRQIAKEMGISIGSVHKLVSETGI